jgi:hypothetical protein
MLTMSATACYMQCRTELLATITTLYSVLHDQMNGDDVRMVIRWLDRFARYPTGTGGDDTSCLAERPATAVNAAPAKA